jgi:hypothetical protein
LNAGIGSVAQPFSYRCFPRISDKAALLLGSCQRLELIGLQPPWLASLVTMHSFGPQLVVIPFDCLDIDPVFTGNRPEPACARGVFQIAFASRIDGRGKCIAGAA